MLIVLLVLCILLMIIFFVSNIDGGTEIGCFMLVGGAIVILFMIGHGNTLLKLQTADEMIAMYEEENARIESQISAAVQGYMEYESQTLTSFAPGDSIALVSLYPELKSSSLVESQLAVYLGNNEEIRELKEKKIKAGRSRWWLYFGNPKTTE